MAYDTYRDRFGVEPICAVLCEHGITIAPSTYYARKACPVTEAELAEATWPTSWSPECSSPS